MKVLDRTSEWEGRPPYDPVKMFKVVMLEQWHSLSDVDLKTALRVRLDLILFCGFGSRRGFS